jgi:hypothetical protein
MLNEGFRRRHRSAVIVVINEIVAGALTQLHADRVEEFGEIGLTAKFAVGDRMQADLFLHRDDFADGFIFELPQRIARDLSGVEFLARRDQPGRTHKAADMVGAKGRKGAFHASSSFLNCRHGRVDP